ncbi:beta-propeller domain-containing protein [Paenibacillus athensensis]|uniref:Copper amine oxidase-like N-terminal domain-containing protein n=1 Tax=Paenibacillus athensensis TaxID=1967502 RepID=A0A4Y8Q9E5_9BACL|nr:beta-propeller domain-containing protein [Paenibacillus athensensis]MCD1259033.1 beta-propeller domain-containing protein [Paenibacillus athensensis]
MKKWALWSLVLLTAASTISATAAADSAGVRGPYPVDVEGSAIAFATAPQNVDGHLMVPIRDTADALGVSIVWDEQRQAVASAKGSASVTWTLGSRTAAGTEGGVTLEAAPYLSGGRVMVPLRTFAEAFGYFVLWNEATHSLSLQRDEHPLPLVGTADKLAQLLASSAPYYGGLTMRAAASPEKAAAPVPAPMVGAAGGGATADGMAGSGATAGEAAGNGAPGSGAAGYSETNVQVAGVDEADIVKTDGTYLYQVSGSRINVSQAVPAGQMSVVGTVDFDDGSFQPQELYVDGNRLIVIGSTLPLIQPYADAGDPVVSKRLIMPIRPQGRITTKAIVYDISDKSKLLKQRELELEGSYLSSRKIGSSLYLAANKSIYSYMLQGSAEERDSVAPAYRDSLNGDAFTVIPYAQVKYFPGAVSANYLMIGGVDLDAPGEPMQVTSVVGSGSSVYASDAYLYVATTVYPGQEAMEGPTAASMIAPAADDTSGSGAGSSAASNPATPVPTAAPTAATDAGGSDTAAVSAPAPTAGSSAIRFVPQEANTVVYRFALDRGGARPSGSGSVPGTVLNQFSLDEHAGYLRVATTSGDMWRSDEHTSKSNVYVLDGALQTAGKLEGLAPGEKIYAVRFLGDRAYVVTFKKVDPLFVLDLHDPAAPAVLGKLKIPGYSDYLHPYDATHLIGFGKDAVEAANEWDPQGSTTAYYQGMKIALFDVSDVSQPKELFKTAIGARGTDSELLYNHKALLFDQQKGLLAFPVTVTEAQAAGSGQAWEYGDFAFQGLYVYHLDLNSGFDLRGKISHLTATDLQQAGSGWYDSNRNVQRGLYVGNVLYSVSPGMIKANDLTTLAPIGELKLP